MGFGIDHAVLDLAKTMREGEIVENALTQQGFTNASQKVDRFSLQVQKNMLWRVASYAHDIWRSQLSVLEKASLNEFSTALNMFMPLELAGPLVYDIWTEQFMQKLGFQAMVGQAVKTIEEERRSYERKAPSKARADFLNELFEENRHAFVVEHQVAGCGDLLRYVTTSGEMFGKRTKQCPAATRLSMNLSTALREDKSFAFRLTSQILVANGRVEPIYW